MKVGSLCTGYGGIEMGLALAGEDVDLRWLAEFDPALDPLHPPGVPNLGDLTLIDWSTVEPVDLLTAGFPCQPVSSAGAQLAEADPRWLWPEVHRAIAALRPERVLLENVRNLVSMRKGEIWAYILSDLTALGYDVRWLTLGACAVGAAHHRHRVFALATYAETAAGPREQRYVRSRPIRLDVQECGARRGPNGGAVAVGVGTATDSRDSRNLTAGRSPDARPSSTGTTLGDFAVIVGALLPSPSASSYGSNQGGAAGRVGPVRHSLGSMARLDLLPTPRATDGVNGGPGQRGSAGDLAMPSAVQPEHWGRFAAAVARHAAIFGPPPAPTEPNRNGAPRLAPAFAEWLMVIPPGHVTARLPRSAALKAIGNGVCPPQLAAAWRLLANTAVTLDDSSSSQVVSAPMTEDETAAAKPISAQIRDIQDRDAAGRARVVNAAMMSDRAFAERNDADRFSVGLALQAAMMELGKVWDEDAAWWEASGKRGRQSTAKLRRDAAVLLRGVAVGLTLHPTDLGPHTATWHAPGSFLAEGPTAETWPNLADPRPVTEQLTAVQPTLPMHQAVAAAAAMGPVDTLDAKLTDAFGPVDPAYATAPDGTQYCTHPADRRSLLKGGITMCTACGARNPDTAIPAPEVSNVTMPDHPFVTPASYKAKVDRLAFADLPRLAAALPPRDALSHSYVEDMENCGLKVLLRRTAHHNPAYGVGVARPSFSLLGGTAFHTAMEAIERMVIANPTNPDGSIWAPTAMTSPTSGGINVEQFWAEHFNNAVAAAQETVKASPYENPTTWHASQGGKENYDWWLVEGADMVRRYLDTHDAVWRGAHAIFRGLSADATAHDLGIEMGFTMQAAPRSPDGAPLLSTGFIDQVWIVQTSATVLGGLGGGTGAQGSTHNGTGRHIEIHDAKSGSRVPKSTFQLAEYAHAFLQRYPQLRDAGVPVLGRYFLPRKGIWTDAVNLLEAHPSAELEYRYSGAHRAELAQFYPPKVTDLCSACGSRDYCPTQA